MPENSPESTRQEATAVFAEKRVALFIVAYNAEKQIEKTLRRIPDWCRPLFAEIFVIDDSSDDATAEQAAGAGRALELANFSVMKTPGNQGYGGNQKIGYAYAIRQGYDIVILLHGDGQYPPERLPDIVAGYRDPSVSAVFGSRMMNRVDALRGGMPLYKWFGNQILTRIENAILSTELSEFHSGYRSYQTAALAQIPYHLNSDGFHFDTDIIIQLDLIGARIVEIPMPTHYGDEECRVDGMRYAWNCIKSATKSRLHQAGLFFQPNYELPESGSGRTYRMKSADTSLHAYLLRQPWKAGSAIADLGANDGELSRRIAERGAAVTAVDAALPIEIPGVRAFRLDLDGDFPETIGRSTYDAVVALDVIEHLYPPERAVERIYRILKPDGLLFASTANIGYFVMRFTHLLGWFNYGKRGILDRTHHRLFTIRSFRRLLENSGFRVIRIRGFGPPIEDAFGNGALWIVLDRVSSFLAQLAPSLFAFNFLIVARKVPTSEEKMLETVKTKRR